ncbi:MAG: hypothetical protein V7K27_07650 [Nostoc sp.]|uniref:hypothetical protein n=1 Tax=Nostoc sp. TaxID=1180 RepID=UPI002FF8AADE
MHSSSFNGRLCHPTVVTRCYQILVSLAMSTTGYAYATQNFSILAILCLQSYQQNVTLDNYGLLTMP